MLEDTCLDWLDELGWDRIYGPDIAPDTPHAERSSYSEVILKARLRAALARINPEVADAGIEQAVKKLLAADSPNLIVNNRNFHRCLTDGIDVEVTSTEEYSGVKHLKVFLVDIDDVGNNDWLALNQLTVIEKTSAGRPAVNRRADVALYVNGLPLAVLELKNPGDENATIEHAFNQLQTYKQDIPSLFTTNELLVISDGLQARAGMLSSERDRFMPWRTVAEEEVSAPGTPELETLVKGLFNHRRFLDYILNFIVFRDDGAGLAKIGAAYHQYQAVNKALGCTLSACGIDADPGRLLGRFPAEQDPWAREGPPAYGKGSKHFDGRKVGVVWHTQGSGKSLSMVFYAGKVARYPDMNNPTLVVITDRNDLDDQLFGAFAGCRDLLRQSPAQAESRSHMQELLSVAAGGVVFTTIQKFMPEARGAAHPLLSERRNIVVIADEAHRSQYDFIDGFARHLHDALPHASFIGFTGTPIEAQDRNTPAVFGDYTPVLHKKFYKSASRASIAGSKRVLRNVSRSHRWCDRIIADTTAVTARRALSVSRDSFPQWAAKREVFATMGYIDIYDISRAFEDGATVRIYYESRLARIELSAAQLERIDPEFERITEAEEEADKQKLKSKWAALEALVGADKRIRRVAADLVEHFEQRLEVMDGKAMVVGMSRRICVDFYQAIQQLRPEWHSDEDAQGALKIVMSGSASDPVDWQPHIRSKAGREALAKRFKDPRDGLKMVIVRDMWLTGFDCPSLHTMYIDKPMDGHNLMQAIARVNRVFRDKPGGLVVDYIGLADSLKTALADYSAGGGKGETTIDQEQAALLLMEKYEVARDMLHGFDYRAVIADAPGRRISGIARAMEFILGLEDGKKRFLEAVSLLTKAFALAVPHKEALAIRDEVGFFQAVRAALLKRTGDAQGRTPHEMDSAIKQLVSEALASNDVEDIFASAGVDKPDMAILSDDFLAEVKNLPYRNLAVELLKKLINDEIKTRSKKNVVQARSFADMLKNAVAKYQNRAIEAAAIIQELIELARELRESGRRGERLGLSDDEIAFYDALADNGSARELMGDEPLRAIARLLVKRVKNSVSIDWTLRENVRAQIRVMVKRILREYGYPPDLQQAATELVIEQAEVLCSEWSAAPHEAAPRRDPIHGNKGRR